MVSRTPHWHIVGAGALGCLWASYLQLAGYKVTLVVRRAEQAQQLTQHGLYFKQSAKAPEIKLPIQAKTLDQLSHSSKLSHVIIATKAYQSVQACSQLKPYLAPSAHILLLQNGLGSQERVCHQLAQQHIYALVSSDGALLTPDNHLHHTGKGNNSLGLLHLANKDEQKNSHPPDWFQSLAQNIALDIQWHPQIELALLQKLGVNCAINALSASLDCLNGQLTQAPYLSQFTELCEEIQNITDALCCERKLPRIEVFKQALAVAQKTAANSSSMRQDIVHQRPSEIAFINGYLVKQAQRLQLPHALNRDLCQRIYTLSPDSPSS